MKHSEKVPNNLKDRYEEIVSITDKFCIDFLNEEYKQMVRYLIASLSRKRPSPIERGRANSWACGAVHAIGFVNFLSDSSTEPYMSMGEFYKEFGVSKATGGEKSKQIRDIFNMRQFDPNWTLSSNIDNNPMVWFVQTSDGIIIDARSLPIEVQEVLVENGIIPYVAKLKDEETKTQTLNPANNQNMDKTNSSQIYQLKIELAYIQPPIWRRVLVESDVTFDKLHQIIQVSMGWDDCHLYSFYDKSSPIMPPDAEMEGKNSNEVKLNEVLRNEKDKVAYVYDFGDSWEHIITLEKIVNKEPNENYPKCIKGKRACPPEDCGGEPGYYEFVEIMSDKSHSEYEDMVEWFGGKYDPEKFDVKTINKSLKNL